MNILLGHVYAEYSSNSTEKIAAWVRRLNESGFNVDSFSLSHKSDHPIIYWPDLDRQWKTGNRQLLTFYELLARKLEDYHVFLNFNGINLHPDFVQQLPTFNVYACFDDPESSEKLSKPVAWAYDLSMVGNIAEVDAYRKWGVHNVKFWPLGFRFEDYQPALSLEQILHGNRSNDLVLLCEKLTAWRRNRLEKYAEQFPQGEYWGLGWPNGFLSEDKRVPLLQCSKIGVNIHNSTGPINFRTYYLPANGVMQICDNKSFLGKLFVINKEVVGFDTIDEAIELTRYYINHDEERRQIAAAGWQRAIADYNEIEVFQRLVNAVNEVRSTDKKGQTKNAIAYISTYRKRSAWKQIIYQLCDFIVKSIKRILQKLKKIAKKIIQN